METTSNKKQLTWGEFFSFPLDTSFREGLVSAQESLGKKDEDVVTKKCLKSIKGKVGHDFQYVEFLEKLCDYTIDGEDYSVLLDSDKGCYRLYKDFVSTTEQSADFINIFKADGCNMVKYAYEELSEDTVLIMYCDCTVFDIFPFIDSVYISSKEDERCICVKAKILGKIADNVCINTSEDSLLVAYDGYYFTINDEVPIDPYLYPIGDASEIAKLFISARLPKGYNVKGSNLEYFYDLIKNVCKCILDIKDTETLKSNLKAISEEIGDPKEAKETSSYVLKGLKRFTEVVDWDKDRVKRGMSPTWYKINCTDFTDSELACLDTLLEGSCATVFLKYEKMIDSFSLVTFNGGDIIYDIWEF